MVRHAERFAAEGFRVELVGLTGRELRSSVRQNRFITERRVRDLPRGSSLVLALVRQVLLSVRFAFALVRLPRPELVILQNPPLITVIAVPLIRGRLQRFPLWIDWHNMGAAMAAARFSRAWLASLVTWLETRLGRGAGAHTTVSEALTEHLRVRDIHAETLYDAPAPGLAEKAQPRRKDAAAVVVLPMSWGVDDDLELLFDALNQFDRASAGNRKRLDLMITGDGPRRAGFMDRIDRADLTRIDVSSRWIPADQYRTFLATADAGLSVHRSTSGLDLPIKWWDLLEVGLPLLTLVYGDVVEERLSRIPSSRRFHDAEELAALLEKIAAMTAEQIEQWKSEARRDLAALPNWEEEWRRVASPIAKRLRRDGKLPVKPKMLIINGTLAATGGGDHLAALAIEALRDRFDLTLLLQKPPDLDGLNRVFGTELRDEDFSVVTLPRRWRLLVSAIPFRLALLRRALQFRQARGMMDDYDVIVSVDNEVDVGAPAVQYIHFPWGFLPRPESDLQWFHKFPGVIAAYYGMVRGLLDVDDQRIANNLTFVNSRWTGKKFVERYPGGSPVVLHPPVKLDENPLPWREKSDQFVAVGRISPEKKLEESIAILEQVRGRGHDVRLVIIGLRDNERYFRRIENLASTREWVTIREALPHEKLLAALRQSRYGIHAMPLEHFGIVVAQMIGYGCVPFVRDDGGPFEIVRDRRLAFASIPEAVERIDAVLRDEHLQSELSERMRSRAHDLGVEAFREKLVNELERWLEED